ncbi:MAG: response regulator [Clostridia bacterium]|nr:response regulator [Clostridia bacterium]
MIVYAFDEQQGLKELKRTLTQILGSELQFRGFTSVGELLKSAKREQYDVLFADLEIQNRRGLYLLGQLHYEFPHTNYIGAAIKPNQADALTLHRIHAVGYIFKPYGKETLDDSLAYLRYPIREIRNIY